MPKYRDIIKQAKSGKPADQITSRPDNQQTSQPDEPMKNLCVKVPESWRRHWAAQAKLTGRTMTDVIVEALTEELG